MKKNRKMEGSTLEETPKKQSGKKNRLSGMLESMENRSNPISIHKIATDYFQEFRRERELPPYPTENKEVEEDKTTMGVSAVSNAVVTPLDTAADTPVGNEVDTRVDPLDDKEIPKEKPKPFKFEYLDATHNSSEAKVYSVMYRECKRLNRTQYRFGLKELKAKTGLSDKTVRVSIHTLEHKLSIKTVEPSMGIYGRKFEVYGPKEILEARRKAKMEIDPTTKRIITREPSTVNTTVGNRVGRAKDTTAVSKVRDSTVSAVKSTAHNINNLNKDNSIKQGSSSNKKASFDDIDDSIFNHKNYIISLYEKYTRNKWRVGDDKTYDGVKKYCQTSLKLLF